MARVPRQLHAGGWYHVYNRGLSSRAVFESRFDRRFFLSLLAKQVHEGRVLVHAYCLMTNHYHLLVELPGVDLPTAMREIGRHYTRRFNARRDRDGPLFRARYASRYIEDLAYRDTVLWYIDHNPVKAGLVRNAADHPWSSAYDFDQGTRRPWLERAWVEGVVRRGTGTAGLRRGSYRALRDPNRTWSARAEEFVASRLASQAPDASGWQAERFEEWLGQRAQLAEGGAALLPMASPGAIRELVEQQRSRFPAWRLTRGTRTIDLHDILQVAALRMIAGLPLRELRATVGGSNALVHRRLDLHAMLSRTDERYRVRFEALAIESRQRSLCVADAEPRYGT